MGGTPPPLNRQSLCSKKLSGKGGDPPPLNGQNPLSSFWQRPLCCVTFLQTVQNKFYVFLLDRNQFFQMTSQPPNLSKFLWLDVLVFFEKLKPIILCIKLPIMLLFNIYALLICFMRLEFSAKKFWLKVKRDWILLEH